MTSSVTSQRDFEYCPLYSRLRDGGSGANVLRSNVNIVIIILGYTWPKNTLRNKTSQDRSSKLKITGLPGDIDT